MCTNVSTRRDAQGVFAWRVNRLKLTIEPESQSDPATTTTTPYILCDIPSKDMSTGDADVCCRSSHGLVGAQLLRGPNHNPR